MELNSYLKRNHGSTSKLATKLGLSPVLVSQWATGKRFVPIPRCPAIERATNGAVTRQDLRPQDWHLIWPELAASPCTCCRLQAAGIKQSIQLETIQKSEEMP